jgi:hypothetical protein
MDVQRHEYREEATLRRKSRSMGKRATPHDPQRLKSALKKRDEKAEEKLGQRRVRVNLSKNKIFKNYPHIQDDERDEVLEGYSKEVGENYWQCCTIDEIDARRVDETDWENYVDWKSCKSTAKSDKECSLCPRPSLQYRKAFSCIHCKKQWHSTCIISYLMVTGRCEYCDKRLGPRWPEQNWHAPDVKPMFREVVDPAFQVPDEKIAWWQLPE